MSVVFKTVLFNARAAVNAWRDALSVMPLSQVVPLLPLPVKELIHVTCKGLMKLLFLLLTI
jgi:hypothetical protein